MAGGRMVDERATPSLAWLVRQDPAVRREALEEAAERGRDEDVELLVASLRDEHPGVQQAAVIGLARVGGAAVATRLVGLLREPPAIRNMAVEVIEQILPAALDAALPMLRAADPNVRKLVVDALGKEPDPRVIGPLIELVADPNPNVRASAVEALGRLHAREAVPAITARLRDEEWVVFSALGALAEIGDPAALPPLLDLVRAGDGAARYAAVEAVARLDQTGVAVPALIELAEAGEAALRPALIKALVTITESAGAAFWAGLDRPAWLAILTEATRDPDPELRLSAVSGLGRLGDQRGTRAILTAYRRWDCPSEEIGECVVRALAGAGDVPELIRAASQDHERVSAVAVRALGELGAPEAVPVLAAVRETNQNWEVRRLALAALARVGTPEALDRIAEAIDDPTGHVRCDAVRLLGASGRTADVLALFAKLETERYQEVRDEIVDTLVRVTAAGFRGRFVPLLVHVRPEVREAAARAIGSLRLPEGLAPLIDAMNDPEWSVRQAVVEALGRYDDPQAFRPLFLAVSDDHEKVRLAATLGLARWNTAEARTVLITQCLRDADVWVRFRAVERLGALGVTEAAPLLAEIALDEQEPALLRRAAVAALGAVGGERARALLSELLGHERAEVREAAAAALEPVPDPAGPVW